MPGSNSTGWSNESVSAVSAVGARTTCRPAEANSALALGMSKPWPTRRMRVMPSARRMAAEFTAFERVSRDCASLHLASTPNSSSRARSMSGASALPPYTAPPVTRTGSFVLRARCAPYRTRSSVRRPSVSPPYSGARRVPPPRITIAWASRACARSSTGLRSTARRSACDTTGSESASRPRTPSHARTRPHAGRRPSTASPSSAIRSGPVGGRTRAASAFFAMKRSRS